MYSVSSGGEFIFPLNKMKPIKFNLFLRTSQGNDVIPSHRLMLRKREDKGNISESQRELVFEYRST